MRISEQQLHILLGLLHSVVNGTLEYELEQMGVDALAKLAEFYEELLNQQNEIVDTSRYYRHTSDEYLRLALDLFEGHEILGEENFVKSPLGQRAEKILYAELHQRKDGRGPCLPGTKHPIDWLVTQLACGSSLDELAKEHDFDLAVAKRVVQELRWPRKEPGDETD